MVSYFIILSLSLLSIFVVSSKFIFARGLSFDYWDERQFNILRFIGGSIGVPFLLSIIFICIYSNNRFSDFMIMIVFWLYFSELLTMVLYVVIVSIIAWKKKSKILSKNIRAMLKENASITDKKKLLEICLYENRGNFTSKQIEYELNKILK